MTNSDSPAGPTGGPVTLSGLDDLPEKLRVHALAKLLGRTSREVMAALLDLGFAARSVQSSVNRKTAEQVAVVLRARAGRERPRLLRRRSCASPPVSSRPSSTSPRARPSEPAAVLAPLFAPPAPVFQPPRPARRRRAGAAPSPPPSPPPTRPLRTSRSAAPAAAVRPGAPRTRPPRRSHSTPWPTNCRPTRPPARPTPTDDQADDESGEGGARRRRRRGRRGRGRGRGGEGDGTDADADTDDDAEGDDADETDDADTSAEESAEGADESDDEAGASRRRRRRRRRRGSGDDASADDESDPPNTVVKVRAPRERPDDTDGDGVQSVRGSTRLEAKRQRRRDGRDAGRRRVPILSEAEFLARRESVERSMVVRERGDRVEIGVLEDGVLVEHFVTSGASGSGSATNSLVGNIYLGRVQNVLPSMEAAFVDIGRGRNAVLYAGEVDWDAAGLGGRARRIEQALSSGDSVLVQVTKDPVGHKGARLTTQISLAGRFLVYVPSGGAAGISRKLPDVERKRLKDLLREIVPSEAGVIIRTASEGVTQEALERDVRRLQAQWEVVKEKAEKTGPNRPKAPVLLYEEPDMLIKVVRDQFNEDFSRLVIAGDDAWETVSNYVGHVAPELAARLHRHIGPRDVFEEYRIDEQLLKALDRKVWLPSGGTLVIDRTEAMTVIDVNTGKFTGSGGNLEETVTRNNLEAAEEIVRQLRLRDIGGIIVIDFIDMVLEANRDLVLRRLTECLARDRTRHQVAEVTSLGLVQMTRKRVGGGLLEHFSTPCEHCRGRGVIVATEPRGRVERARPGRARAQRRRRWAARSRPGTARRGERRPGPAPARGSRCPTCRRSRPRPRSEASPAVPRRGRAGRGAGRARCRTRRCRSSRTAARPAWTSAHRSRSSRSPRRRRWSPRPSRACATTSRRSSSSRRWPSSATGTRHRTARSTPAEPVTTGGLCGRGQSGTNGAVAPGSETVDRPEPVGRRRRGRVTRTAGAPTAVTGDAPTVGVVTVPSARAAEEHAAEPGAGDVAAPPAPEPVVAPRARRVRRAASRPAGPARARTRPAPSRRATAAPE